MQYCRVRSLSISKTQHVQFTKQHFRITITMLQNHQTNLITIFAMGPQGRSSAIQYPNQNGISFCEHNKIYKSVFSNPGQTECAQEL